MRWITRLAFGSLLLPPLLANPIGGKDRPGPDRSPGSNRVLLDESWYVLWIDGAKVGHRHIIETKWEHGVESYLETTANEHLQIVREGQRVTADVQITSRETMRGELIDFEYELPLGRKGTRIAGRVDGRTLRMRSLPENTPEPDLAWPDKALGPFGVETSLRQTPLHADEKRALQLFFPAVNQIVDVTLQGLGWETTELPGGAKRLLRVDLKIQLPGGAVLASSLWTDRHGLIWKDTQKMGVTVTAYRTTRQSALAPGNGEPLDLFQSALIPLDPPRTGPLSNPAAERSSQAGNAGTAPGKAHGNLHECHEIEYELMNSGGDPARLFVQDHRQTIRSIAAHAARLRVRAHDAPQSATDPIPAGDSERPKTESDLPAAADKKSSTLAPSDDPRIRELAWTTFPDSHDARTVVAGLGRLVYHRIEEKSYGQVFASATDVLELREGDCTEHTVLLIALCRARKIPARAAMGLVYSDAHHAFAYHMWTEAWTGSHWLGYDATRPTGRVGPAHLKMATSHLDDASALTEMLSLLQAVDGLEMRVLHAR